MQHKKQQFALPSRENVENCVTLHYTVAHMQHTINTVYRLPTCCVQTCSMNAFIPPLSCEPSTRQMSSETSSHQCVCVDGRHFAVICFVCDRVESTSVGCHLISFPLRRQSIDKKNEVLVVNFSIFSQLNWLFAFEINSKKSETMC